jgi:cell division ATPase FtsA
METPLLAVNFTPGAIKGFSLIMKEDNVQVLDSLERIYEKSSLTDLKIKLIDLILEMEKRGKINFYSAILGVKKGPGKEITKEIRFLRKHPQKPISEKEFKKMIEDCQKEAFFKLQKAPSRHFNFVLVSAKIKEIIIDDRKVANPIGVLGQIVSLLIKNLYLPENFYKIIAQTFSKLKIQISFEVS